MKNTRSDRQYEIVAKGADGGGMFMLLYGAMVQDMTAKARRDKHRRKQSVTVKGIFRREVMK